MTDPKNHRKSKRFWIMGIGTIWLILMLCCCLVSYYGFVKVFPALVLMLFPSHILTAPPLLPTATMATPGSPARVSTPVSGVPAGVEPQNANRASQKMVECNQAADDLPAVSDSAERMPRPLRDDGMNGSGVKLEIFSTTCCGLDPISGSVPHPLF